MEAPQNKSDVINRLGDRHFILAVSAVVVKFYLGDAKNLTTFFWQAEIFDDLFRTGTHISHKFPSSNFFDSLSRIYTESSPGGLVVVNCLVVVNLVATNLIWGMLQL
jgi:hypothetical protein